MGDIITLLPEHVANQIAAGEVVQRPASVVKELLENAVDAGAKEIHLIIREAGKSLIQVVDNGSGMSYADARTAFERHATSKIRQADDLFDLHTMGFRGEALASISAVAQVELRTRRQDEELGTEVRVEGSTVVHQKPCQTAPGTHVAVKNLFYNIPARRQFLKSDAVEKRHIIDAFEYIALAHPEIGFRLTQDDAEIFHLLPGKLRQRITGVFGKKYNERLVPVSEETDVVRLSGFVLKPQHARKTRGEQFFFVNLRYIKNSYLHHAVGAAFNQLIKADEHPSYFLFLEIDPKRIDVNIHPTKTEIKFDDESAIYAIIRSAVRHALGQFNIAPSLDFERNVSDMPAHDPNRQIRPPVIQVDPNFNPFTEDKGGQKMPVEKSGQYSSGFKKEAVDPNWQTMFTAGSEADPGKIEITSDWDKAQDSGNQPCFQLDQRFIITKSKGALVAIHQQRAHRRILYEHFLHLLRSRNAASQQLLFPHTLNVGTSEVEALRSIREDLHRIGFEIEFQGKQNAVVQGIPLNMNDSEVEHVVESLLEDVKQESDTFRNDPSHGLARSMSASTSIRTGQTLSESEMQHLINELFACEMPYTDVNGQPIVIQIGTAELVKKFK